MTLDATISLIVGIVGTGVSIYQWGVINESKTRRKELQFLLAGIGHSALSRSQAWVNQISLYPPPANEHDLQVLRTCARARDDLGEIHNLVSALEGAIDSESSAIHSILEKILKQGELNNRIQEVGLKNPARKLAKAQDADGH